MNDSELITRCQQGSQSAFEKLLQIHYDTIYRFAYRWCGDQHNAQDITQLACMKLSKAIHQYEHRASFTSWLYRLVINCAKDYYKSPSQHNTREEQQDDQSENYSARQNDRIQEKLYAQQILEHINTLSVDLRDTLILVYGTGLSHLEAAARLNVKESTVSWRVHEARKLLKQTFNASSLDSRQTKTGDNDQSNDAMRGSV